MAPYMRQAPYEKQAIELLKRADSEKSLPTQIWIWLAAAGVYAILDIANAIRARRR